MFISIHGTIDARETLEQLRKELGMKLNSKTFTVSIDNTTDIDGTVLDITADELEYLYEYMEETFLARVRLLGQKHQVKLTAAMID